MLLWDAGAGKQVGRVRSFVAGEMQKAVEDYWKSIPKEDRPYLAKHHPGLSPDERKGYEALLRLKSRVI